jgi:predicted dehydrogenase
MKKLRWGILSAARIAPKNWKAIFYSSNNTVTAVASRDAARSQKFIADCQRQYPFAPTPVALGSYEELIASPDVDAVYIPLPTGLRKEWVIRAAEAGKHILCEKPCATSTADLEAMLATCRKHRVQFMDGVMFVHHPRQAQLRAALDDGESVGEIRRVQSHFSFLGAEGFADKNIRASAALEPMGCLGDLGWYCVRFSLWAMNWQMPSRVTAQILSAFDNGVPSAFAAEMFFDGGVTAGFFCSFTASQQATAVVTGTKSFLRVQDLVHPFVGSKLAFETIAARGVNNGCDMTTEATLRQFSFADNAHEPAHIMETLMFRNFADAVLAGKINESWAEQALKTQRVVTDCFEAARCAS